MGNFRSATKVRVPIMRVPPGGGDSGLEIGGRRRCLWLHGSTGIS